MSEQKPHTPDPSGLPFPKHWLWYIVIKIVVLALAVYLGLRYQGLV